MNKYFLKEKIIINSDLSKSAIDWMRTQLHANFINEINNDFSFVENWKLYICKEDILNVINIYNRDFDFLNKYVAIDPELSAGHFYITLENRLVFSPGA